MKKYCLLFQKETPPQIQIIGMSATLPNLDLLASWLDSQLFSTDYRPVPLAERVKIGTAVYDAQMEKIRELDPVLTVKVRNGMFEMSVL